MARSKLPIGIDSFREIREQELYYVDKTPHIERLMDDGKHFLLSRPRRFGKSLLISTLKELFDCNEGLFIGLAIHNNWDWDTPHPVIRLNFSSGLYSELDGLQEKMNTQLDRIDKEFKIDSLDAAAPVRFAEIIRQVREACGNDVIVLIDEYDKPIVDVLETPNRARKNRDFLRGVYSAIKECNEYIRFSLMTGVSNFANVNLFSGVNNLIDITIDKDYSTICGYTESDLDSVFREEIIGLDRERIRVWYNGYSWGAEEKVYNPFDILFSLRNREFDAYWIETGTPTFLVDLLFRKQINSVHLDKMVASQELISSFDVDAIEPATLLFQTGYLTIEKIERDVNGSLYHLAVPNLEVRTALHNSFLNKLVGSLRHRVAHSTRLRRLLLDKDFEGLREVILSFFASIPYEWYTQNDLENYEGFYASVFYSYFAGLGYDSVAEDSTNHGRITMAIRLSESVCIFEFKILELASSGDAMGQMKERGYSEKYRVTSDAGYLIAVEFSSATRNISSFEVEKAW